MSSIHINAARFIAVSGIVTSDRSKRVQVDVIENRLEIPVCVQPALGVGATPWTPHVPTTSFGGLAAMLW